MYERPDEAGNADRLVIHDCCELAGRSATGCSCGWCASHCMKRRYPMSKRDLYAELEDFDGTYPKSWLPKPGDIIVGRILRYTSGRTDYGKYPIAVVEDAKTKQPRSVWLMHQVLRNEFEDQQPKVGETIGIKCLPKSEKGYKRYVLRVKRDEPSVPDFSQYAAPGDVAPEDKASLLDEVNKDDDEEDLPF